MPKRSHEEKLERYHRKIQKIQERENRRRRRIIESSDSENEQDIERSNVGVMGSADEVIVDITPTEIDSTNQITAISNEPVPDPELDPEILSALGEFVEETPRYGEKIHEKLSILWTPILKKGILKEEKEKLLKKYPIPENCTLLQAPKLNPELSAAIPDITRFKDKRVEVVQQQLGAGVTALCRGLTLLFDNEQNKVQAIKHFSDSCRILCDLHNAETQARIKLITPALDKGFLNVIQDVNRDDTLFGKDLSEKIKASKAIEKQGLQIKKVAATPKPSTSTFVSHTPSSSRPRYQGNWMGPPRYPSNRGGRGGHRRPTSTVRKMTTAPPPPPPSTMPYRTNQTRPRAPSHPQ